MTVSNNGGENMSWKIQTVSGGDWLKTVVPSSGVLRPGASIRVNLTVDTTSCLDPNLYVAELTVVANGSVPRWIVLLRFVVRDIVIDATSCSKPAPQRSNVNETVSFAFHAKWTHNGSDAVLGAVTITGSSTPLTTNNSGWINFATNLFTPGSRTYGVASVDFSYAKDNQTYHIRSFTQRAENLTAIWDSVKIVLNLADERIDINSEADVTYEGSVYEYDNSPFVGFVNLNDTLTKATVGRYCITASSINDTKYGLTAFQSNSVFCVWDRFKINVGGVSNKQTQVGKAETVWMMALYEYDNTVFKGANGTLYLDVYTLVFNESSHTWTWVWERTDPMDFSSLYDRWEKSYSFDNPGPRTFVVSQKQPIEDRLYNLTTFNDLVVPTLDTTWREGGWSPWPDPLPPLPRNNPENMQPIPTQNLLEFPLWAFAGIVITLAIGLSLIFALILISAKRNNHKSINENMKR
jgi:hypothetical protein